MSALAASRKWQAEERASDIDLTPMLDVVFIMLVFFVVTATFLRETGLDINPPNDDPIKTVETAASILITIDAADAILLDGRRIDPRALRANIERRHASHPDQTGVVMPLRGSSAKLLLDAARQAHIYDIALAQAPSD